MTAVVQLEHVFAEPLLGLESSTGPMAVTRAEVTFTTEGGFQAVLRGFGMTKEGTVGGAKRVVDLPGPLSWKALPADLRGDLLITARVAARELYEALG